MTLFLTMTDGSGCLMNPAQALAQAIYTLVMGNLDKSGYGDRLFKNIWPYPIFPYVGGILAGVVYHLHHRLNQ